MLIRVVISVQYVSNMPCNLLSKVLVKIYCFGAQFSSVYQKICFITG